MWIEFSPPVVFDTCILWVVLLVDQCPIPTPSVYRDHEVLHCSVGYGNVHVSTHMHAVGYLHMRSLMSHHHTVFVSIPPTHLLC